MLPPKYFFQITLLKRLENGPFKVQNFFAPLALDISRFVRAQVDGGLPKKYLRGMVPARKFAKGVIFEKCGKNLKNVVNFAMIF